MTESVAWLNPKNYNCRSATCAHFCARLCILNTLYKLNVARVFSLWNFITCTRACFFFGSFQTFPFFFFFFLSLKRADHLSRVKSRAFFRAREKFVKKRLVSFGWNTINFTDANYATLWAWWRKKNRKKMEWISNSETNSYEINLSDHETRLILARSSFSTNFPDHANTLMLIIIARFFLESNTTITFVQEEREREKAFTSSCNICLRDQCDSWTSSPRMWHSVVWIFEGCVAVCPPSRRRGGGGGGTLSNLD